MVDGKAKRKQKTIIDIMIKFKGSQVSLGSHGVTLLFIAQGPVVRRPISANPGLDFNLGFFIPLL